MHKTSGDNFKMPDATLYSLLPHRRAIRLLRIKSGTGEEGIQITLETFNLDSKTQFTALSYVWGDTTSPCEIICNGHTKSITRNLLGVLSQLQKQQFNCLLWVDAICINQRDEEEKSFQVAMMRDIYKRAAKVIFWLGQQELYDEDAINLMRSFSQRFPHRLDLERHRLKTLEEMNLSSFDRGWAGWASLFCRPWFGRVWIVQEFSNATKSVFMSGALEIPTELLLHCGFATEVCVAIREVVCRERDVRDTGKAILRLFALGVGQFGREMGVGGGPRIFDIWCRSQQLEATDPRDRVFALLSTQTAVGMEMINYRKSEATVFTEIAATALNILVPRITWIGSVFHPSQLQVERNNLHRVSRFLACKFCSPGSSDLPSWVPDWKPIGFNFVPLTRYYTGTTTFTHPYDHAIVKEKVLYISGTILDEPTVIINSKPYMDPTWPAMLGTDTKTRKSARDMMNWISMCYVVAMSILLPSAEDVRFERLCRAMAFGVRLEETDILASHYMKGLQALFSAYESLAGQAHYHPSLLRSYSEPGSHNKMYESGFYELSAGRKFSVTKQKYLAWVPVDTRPTDRICFLAGCAVPFVVRPVDQHYELVGDCCREDLVLDAGRKIRQKPQLFEFR
ncbi:heterokaryon incompatibility protein-domain-containing protein [Alternaria rosae]|uniref:heterokaryon incompatibility protein-domain-containing protein n=1 Tax=Alternaria rosae TaxID=1187941 RepID=UPI001E8E20A8|nr:heterokaryon incompatibility protein-domain-containing protein [Alternaria rosae]KAH6870814.1 heterokaryon incompatibility protein-domain-containing protein [Alternaria rosae]